MPGAVPPLQADRGSLQVIPGDFHEQCVLGRKLGQGSFASVYSVSRLTAGLGSQDAAVKVVDTCVRQVDGRRLPIRGRTQIHGGA